ncbi:restriction endonuclease subunit S [[Clostridium] innocuum]|uniref:restriction endonuclease subunit S n=1 Tax=Clostridium innocuum TaxID=1522 RepID=UPI001F5613C5|nr:restriction endonuclease subunit S [[Clostridium] innocuum]MCI7368539.1 restriction endonuclease subunit S [[Clostridium] innocuum]MCR0373710.1 restriction endonuclease subunit S [[Clostridium] innocuum]MDY3045350.1 restriction endonuclease subunit S [[Clostridium] innocuum]
MKKPKIRFNGFNDDWEQRKLGDITESYSGGTPTAGKKEYYDGNIPFIRSGEISSDKTELFISEEGLNRSSAKMVKIGDILYALYGATSGEVSISKLKGAINQAILAIQPHQNYDSQFLMQWLRKSKENIIGTYLQGGQGNLSGNIVKELIIDIPTYEEQKEIGAYLKKLDHLITLHQRKCDEIKKLKKYMLQNMFPQDEEKVPKIRFYGFTDDWEQRKFVEFVKNAAKKNKDNIDLEPYAVTNDRGFIAQKDAHDDFGYMSNVDRTAYNIVPPNSFAYNPARINVGSLGYYEGTENVIVSSLYEVFQTEEYIDDKFLLHWFKSDSFPRWIEKLQEGSVRLYFYFDKLVQCQMMVPSLEEQKRISAYLDSIDQLITLHQRKCDELKNMKKFMLQNMFV